MVTFLTEPPCQAAMPVERSRSLSPSSEAAPPMFTAQEDSLGALLDQARELAQQAVSRSHPTSPTPVNSQARVRVRSPSPVPHRYEHLGPAVVSAADISAAFPNFKPSEAEHWFLLLENYFQFHRIRGDGPKFHNVLARLGDEVFRRIAADLEDCPSSGKYEWLKQKLCEAYGTSHVEKMDRILNLRQLGSSHPMTLLGEVKALLPQWHKMFVCPSCHEEAKLPPCPVAYSQLRSRMPKAIQREMSTEPSSWSRVSRDLAESWKAHSEISQGTKAVNAVKTKPSHRVESPERVSFVAPKKGASTPRYLSSSEDSSGDEAPVAAVRFSSPARKKQSSRRSRLDSQPQVCSFHFYHGKYARQCRGKCDFPRDESAHTSQRSKPRRQSAKGKYKGKGYHGNKSCDQSRGNGRCQSESSSEN